MPIELGEVIVRANATTQREIAIDGTTLSLDVDAEIETAVVTDGLTMADTFVIVFRDPGSGCGLAVQSQVIQPDDVQPILVRPAARRRRV